MCNEANGVRQLVFLEGSEDTILFLNEISVGRGDDTRSGGRLSSGAVRRERTSYVRDDPSRSKLAERGRRTCDDDRGAWDSSERRARVGMRRRPYNTRNGQLNRAGLPSEGRHCVLGCADDRLCLLSRTRSECRLLAGN